MEERDLAAAAVQLTAELVAIDSVNPGLVPGSAGERRIAEHCAERLRAAGFAVSFVEPPGANGRTSVIAELRFGPGRTLVLSGHLDTVGVDGMPDPFTPRIAVDRMSGRGTCDMKAGVAGLIVAAEALAHDPPNTGRLLVALVADEEDASLGAETVIAELLRHDERCDAVLIGEPTWLDLAVAHRGYALLQVDLRGRAAHTSRPQDGVDAVAHLGRLIAAVGERDRELRERSAHPLLGHAATMVSVASGGSSPFTVAAAATATVERRLLPGEDGALALDELRNTIAALHAADPDVAAEARLVLARAAWEQDDSGPAAELAALLGQRLEAVRAKSPAHVGAPYWMESALWQAAGIPAVVCGPAGGALHAIDEWVDLEQVRGYPAVVAASARDFLARSSESPCQVG